MSEPFPDIRIKNFRLDLNENKARFESPFTRQRQVISLGAGTADRWEGVITTPELYPADVKTMFNFVVKVGLYGQFTIEHPDYGGPESGEFLGAVAGTGQSGISLVCDGFTPNIVVAREGDYFQVRNEFKRLTANANSNGTGVVTFNFRPALRVSPAHTDPVDLVTPLLLCELLTIPSEDTDELGTQAFTLAFQEVLSGV